MMSAWAIIPARGGSKGVPGKNLAPVAGRSLVRRAVEACVEARTVDRVVVSTDDPDIAREATASGAEVVDRPVELAGDAASSESAVLHALEQLHQSGSPLPDVTLLVQCTSPFTTADDLDRLVALTDEFDSVFTAVASHSFLWKRSHSGQMVGVNHDPARRLPRQQLEPEYVESGNAYAMRTSGFLEQMHRFFGAIGMLEIDGSRALEIDTPADLARARALAGRSVRRPADSVLRIIEAVVFDFDGVLTDDTVIVHQDGSEAVTAHRGDGMGISALRTAGVRVLILSKERNPVVSARGAKLGVEVVQGCDDKLPAMLDWMARHGVDPARCVYVGNDVNDLEAMRAVGVAACPADARDEVCAAASWLLSSNGGRGRPAYVVAEIGINHNGDLDLARSSWMPPCPRGCDAVKFQKRTPEQCVPLEQRDRLRETPWGTMTYLEYRHRVEFGGAEYEDPRRTIAIEVGIDWFASCWDVDSVASSRHSRRCCVQGPSAALTTAPCSSRSGTGRPLVLSTGMSTMEQIDAAVAHGRPRPHPDTHHQRRIPVRTRAAEPAHDPNAAAAIRLSRWLLGPRGRSAHHRGGGVLRRLPRGAPHHPRPSDVGDGPCRERGAGRPEPLGA
jgi:YrbI family 3-deoxy-D-manno-octulosonate 8-phosphate phosphatase